jgi:PAS domain S-box-containing protein
MSNGHPDPTPEEAERILRELAGGILESDELNVLPTPIGPTGELYQTLLEQIPAVTFMTSFEEGKQNVYVSPQIQEILGYTPEEWLARPSLWQERLHPDDKERFQEEFSNTVMSRGTSVHSVYRFVHRDGRVVWIQGDVRIKRDEQTGFPLFVQAVGVDVTKLEEEKQRQLEAQKKHIARLQSEVHREFGPDALIGSSKAMEDLRSMIRRVARSDASALVTGESGTGKELVARAIHYSGRRKDGPFVPLNCGAFPEASLLDDALFGHEKGAFTGATERVVGRLEEADGGTLFLDEIGNMPMLVQDKILRFIQERSLRRLGSNKDITVDTRIIAATHKDLRALIEGGQFKADLYFKLKVVEIHVPPLRERASDIPELAAHFLSCANRKEKRSVSLPAEAMTHLKCHSWAENNVRELEHAIEGAVVLCDGDAIAPSDLPVGVMPRAEGNPDPAIQGGPVGALEDLDRLLVESVLTQRTGLKELMTHAERTLIVAALQQARGRKAAAAKLLGIAARVLDYKVDNLGIQVLAETPWARARDE